MDDFVDLIAQTTPMSGDYSDEVAELTEERWKHIGEVQSYLLNGGTFENFLGDVEALLTNKNRY